MFARLFFPMGGVWCSQSEQTANLTYMCINIHKYMYNVQIQYTHMHADKCYLYIKYIVESHVLIEKKIVVRI